MLKRVRTCNSPLAESNDCIDLCSDNKIHVLDLIRRLLDHIFFEPPTILNTFTECLFQGCNSSSEKSNALMKALPDFADEFKSIFENEIKLFYTDNLPAANINLFDCFRNDEGEIYFVDSFYNKDYCIKQLNCGNILNGGQVIEKHELRNNEQFRPVALEELLPVYTPILYDVISLLYFAFDSSFASNFGIQLPSVESCIRLRQNFDVYVEQELVGVTTSSYYLITNGVVLKLYFSGKKVLMYFQESIEYVGNRLDSITARQMIKSAILHDESKFCYNIVKKIYERFCPIVYRLGLIPWLNEVMNCWQSVVCGQPIASYMIENHNPSDVPHYEGSAVKRISTF